METTRLLVKEITAYRYSYSTTVTSLGIKYLFPLPGSLIKLDTKRSPALMKSHRRIYNNCLGRGAHWSNGPLCKRRVIKLWKKGRTAHKESWSWETSGLAKQRSFSYQIALFIVTDISKHEGFTPQEVFGCQLTVERCSLKCVMQEWDVNIDRFKKRCFGFLYMISVKR